MVRLTAMGMNPSRNAFKRARLGLDAQQAVDEYKARSVWGAWWKLDEKVRRRYFTQDERDFITRYGARLDEIACFRTNPSNDDEAHFLRVCVGEDEPRTPRERLWLVVHLVCRYERSANRAARADLAEHDASALRAENRAVKAKTDHLERHLATLAKDLRVATGDEPPSIHNVRWASFLFDKPETFGPPPVRVVVTAKTRGAAIGLLSAAGVRPYGVARSAN